MRQKTGASVIENDLKKFWLVDPSVKWELVRFRSIRNLTEDCMNEAMLAVRLAPNSALYREYVKGARRTVLPIKRSKNVQEFGSWEENWVFLGVNWAKMDSPWKSGLVSEFRARLLSFFAGCGGGSSDFVGLENRPEK